MIRRISAVLLLLAQVSYMVPGSAHAHVYSRTKPGPVTIRGVAVHVTARSFDLKTKSRGTFIISIVKATAVSEKGHSGRAALRENDHVGVRGFLHGRSITAIAVRIYPVKPRRFTVRGTVTSRSGAVIVVGGKRITLSSQTVVHVGSAPASYAAIHVGDQVQVRAVSSDRGVVALSIHVYRHAVRAKPVEVRGTIVSMNDHTLVIRTGSGTVSVRIDGGTAIVLGTTSVGPGSLRPGQTVSVRACCAGTALTATRVHIAKTRVRSAAVEVRGQVAGISNTVIRVVTVNGTVTVSLQPSTIYEVGINRVTRSGIQVGDQVSIRAFKIGHDLRAQRVHVSLSGRRPHTITGTIATRSTSGIIVQARGKRYLVKASRTTGVTVNGKPGALSAALPGDRVRIVGRLRGTTILADRISISRAVLKIRSITVRGTVTRIRGTMFVIVDSTGTSHTVHLSSRVPMLLHGRATPSALFPGVRATVRGTVVHGILEAARITLSVQTRTISGRVTRAQGAMLEVRLAKGDNFSVLLPSGLFPTDGSRRLSHVHPGAFVRIQGYLQRANTLRAVWVHVSHPRVTASAIVVAAGSEPTVETSRGDRFKLRTTVATTISTGRVSVNLHAADIPAGTHIHIEGRVQTDGALLLDRLDVRLISQTVRGTLAAIAGSLVTMQTASGSVRAHVIGETQIVQGSHTITLKDLVVGDDVTLYGAGLGSTLYLRKLLVHRKLMSLNGTVTTVTTDGFVLSASDGEHRIIVTQETLFLAGASPNPVVGTSLHITGYHRGDGSVLATRVRPAKKHQGI